MGVARNVAAADHPGDSHNLTVTTEERSGVRARPVRSEAAPAKLRCLPFFSERGQHCLVMYRESL